MTMVHIATKAISRKAGQSAVASASYRAGVILEDDMYGKTHDYSKKKGVMSADIVIPTHLKAVGFSISRGELWNKAEKAETRKDSRVGREWLINLPHRLDEQSRKALAHEFAQALADKYNIIADVCIHKPVMKKPYDPDAKPSYDMLKKGEENPDHRNYHAHILVTTRAAQLDSDGKLFFDPDLKIPFEWSRNKRMEHGLQFSSDEIKEVRQLWVDIANKKLVEHQLEKMDARSFKDRKIDRLPTVKMGVAATAMERRGIRTDLGNANRLIIERNKIVANSEIIIKQRNDNERLEQATRRIDEIIERNARSKRDITESKRRLAESKRIINTETRSSPAAPNPFDDQSGARARERNLIADRRAEQDNQFTNKSSFYKHTTASAITRVRTATGRIATRLARREYDNKFDKRQMQELDKFARNLGVSDLSEVNPMSRGNFIAEKITIEILSEHKNIVKILSEPVAEREQYSETLKNKLQAPSNNIMGTYEDKLVKGQIEPLQDVSDTINQDNLSPVRRFRI